MTATELDTTAFPVLTGVERPFYDFWSTNILSDEDPHRDRWIDYEENAVRKAHDRNLLVESATTLDRKKVLDVGCQNGAWLVALGQAGATPTGIDVVTKAVEAARIRTKAYGIDADVRVASACELPFATGEFDVVATSDVLEHVPDKVAMLHECARVLRPNGLLFLVVPLRFSVKHLMSDPHYGHPGLSILPGSAAAWASRKFFDEPVYAVETLPTKRWTVRHLRRFGMEILDLDPAFAGRSVPGPAALGAVVDELRQAATIVARKLPGPFDPV